MAGIVNLKTGAIRGVKKGTLAWWHEKGHLEFDKQEKGMKYKAYQGTLFHFSFIFVFASILYVNFIYLAMTFYLFYLAIELYEEKWCWKYAKEMYKKQENSKK